MSIGKLAKAAGVGVETIRYYERRGILRQPPKHGAFRHYPSDFVERVQFVKRAQELGFSLKETKELLELPVQHQAKCSDVLGRATAKIDEIDEKISDLKRVKKSLLALADCCIDQDMPLKDCPIFKCFITRNEGLI